MSSQQWEVTYGRKPEITRPIDITSAENSVIITVKVVPNSSRNSIEGELDGMLKVKIVSVPEKGKANKTLTEFLAKKLGIKAKDIDILSGTTNAIKKVQIRNISIEDFKKGIMQ